MTEFVGTQSTPSPRDVPVPGSSTAAPSTVAAVHRDLRKLFASGGTGLETLDRILQLTALHTDALFVGFFQAHQQSIIPIAVLGEMEGPAQVVAADDLALTCQEAIQRDEMTTRCVAPRQKIYAIAAPTLSNETTPTVLCVLVSAAKPTLAIHALIVDRMATAIVRWRMNDTIARLDWEALACAGAAELISRVGDADSITEATFQLVNELKSFLECRQVAIGLTRSQIGCELRAVSDMAEFDRHSEPVRDLSAAMDECLIRGKPTVWPPLKASQRHATLAHRKLTAHRKGEAVFSVPLETVSGKLVGVILILGKRKLLHDEKIQGAMRAVAPHLATAIDLRLRAEPGAIARLRSWVSGSGTSSRTARRWLTGAMAVFVMGLPWIPFPHYITAECEAEPTVRRYVAVPYQGILQQTAVRPGDVVQKGQVLATIDDRDLRWELSKAMGEAGRARTLRDKAMEEHATADVKLADLKLTEAELKVQLLREREKELEVRSPIGGVILRGDLEDVEGAPVKTGQSLFEVAPLDPLRIVVFIPEQDLSSVAVGDPVVTRLDGYREGRLEAEIARIHPEAEIHNSRNVFAAELDVRNPDCRLRPGMSGYARISSGWRPLGWIWFHHAWWHGQRWLGW